MSRTLYIAGPYTKGDVVLNVRDAIHAADIALVLGWTPFVPHLTHFWHLVSPHEYEQWLAIDMVWLEKCDTVLRLPGDSNGADREVERALRLGLPVVYSLEELKLLK